MADVDFDHQLLRSFKKDFNFVLKAASEGAVFISRLN